MLLDLDGDGRLDLVEGVDNGTTCQLKWYRNLSGTAVSATDISFGIASTYDLPTLPWSGASMGPAEDCSLTGQLTLVDNIPGDPQQCSPTGAGSYLVYRFMDINTDGLPDLVTAVHQESVYYDHDPTSLYATAPTCPAEGPYCSDVATSCLEAAESCSLINDTSYCEYDQAALDLCVSGSPAEECDEIELAFMNFSKDNDDNCGTMGGRAPFEVDCGYLWNVYYNQGTGAGNPFGAEPVALFSPIELDSYQGDGTIGSGRGRVGSSWTNHALQDIDGDGVLDAVHSLADDSDKNSVWEVWRGHLSEVAGEVHLDFDRGNPFMWAAPATIGDSVAVGNNNREGPANEFHKAWSWTGLLDVDGNGRIDFVWGSDPTNSGLHVHRNKGDGFPLDSADIFSISPDIPHLSRSVTEGDEDASGFISDGERFSCIRAMDYDHDGRIDMMDCVDKLDHSSDPRVSFGRGDSVGPAIEVPAFTLDPDREHGHYQFIDGIQNSWSQRAGFVDLDGDGFEEDVHIGEVYTAIGEPLGFAPRLMESIDNGRGLVTTIDYAPHVDESVVDPGSGRTPRAAIVVKSIARSDAHGANGTSTYTYRGPVFNANAELKSGFRGFDEARTKTPLGSLIVNRYDYDVDWSGRLAETLTFADESDYGGDESSSGSDEAHSISKTEWTAFSLFSGATASFQPTVTREYTCSNGQSIDDCETSGALVKNEITYSAIESAYTGPPDQAYVETLRLVKTAEVTQVGDRRISTVSRLHSDDEKHLLKPDDIRRYRINNSAGTSYTQFSRHRYLYNFYGRNPFADITYKNNAMAAVTYTVRDWSTGNTEYTVKPQQYFETTKYGPKTTFTYDAFELYPATITTELGHVVTETYDIATGNQLSREGPNEKSGVKQKGSFAYDAFGRTVSEKVTRDNGASYIVDVEVAKTTYYDSESPQRVRRESLIEFDDTRWATVDEKFDGHGRLSSTTTIVNDPSRPDPVVSHFYDLGGNLTATTVPDPSEDDSSVVTYSTTYDQLGRPTGFSTPATGHDDLHISYDGLSRTRETRDGADVKVEESILTDDEFGRLVKVEEAVVIGSNWATTLYEYDVNDNMTKVTSADGIVTDLGNDWVGRRTSITRGGRTWSYTYDRNDNMLTAVDPVPSGQPPSDYVTMLAYDALDRVTSKIPGSRGMTSQEMDDLGLGAIVYTYDAGDNGIGMLTSVDRGTVWNSTMAYTARGQLVSESKSFTVPGDGGDISDTRTQSYDYNALGQRRETTFADDALPANGTVVVTEFDDAGRPARLKKGVAAIASVERNVAGLPIVRENEFSSSDEERRWREFVYDELGRVTSDKVFANVMTPFFVPVPTSRAVQTFVYDGGLYRIKELRNFVGNAPLGETNPATDLFTFTYDAQNQIDTASGPVGYNADFDYTDGGRLDRADIAVNAGAPSAFARDVTYDYSGVSDPEAVDALVNTGSSPPTNYATYSYDESGNTTSRTEPSGTWSLVYDGEDQQREATAPDGSSEVYYYDESGARILALGKNGSGTPIRLRFWFGGTEIWYDGQGAVDETLAHAAIDGPSVRIRNKATVEHTYHDRRGHLIASLNRTSPNLVAGFTYGPFGEILEEFGSDVGNSLRRFNGKDVDNISALSYYGARYYDSLSLSWTQADSLRRFVPESAFEKPRRANLYAFTVNNPLSKLDPNGLEDRNPTSFLPGSEGYGTWVGAAAASSGSKDKVDAVAAGWESTRRDYANSPQGKEEAGMKQFMVWFIPGVAIVAVISDCLEGDCPGPTDIGPSAAGGGGGAAGGTSTKGPAQTSKQQNRKEKIRGPKGGIKHKSKKHDRKSKKKKQTKAQKAAARKKAEAEARENAVQRKWHGLVSKVGEQTAIRMYPGGMQNTVFRATVK